MLVIFAAVRPATGEDFAHVLPEVSTVAMAIFLEGFAGALPAHVRAVMALDQAGWHGFKKLTVPNNVSLAPLPPYSPERNPAEPVWLFLRERFLAFRVLDDQEAVIDACCDAWNALAAETDRRKSLCSYPWITKVSS